jgi:hypothetical protein
LTSIDEGFCVIEACSMTRTNRWTTAFWTSIESSRSRPASRTPVGRRMREIAPAHEEHWFQIYGQIALTGESRRL